MTLEADDGGDLLDVALEKHRAGLHDEAAGLYEQVLVDRPDNTDALHLLGVIAYQRGQDDRAVELVSRAVSIDPRQGAFHNILGLALGRLGRPDEAAASFERAIAADPSSAQARRNLGILLKDQERFTQAVEHLRRAVDLDGGSVRGHHELGGTLQLLGRHSEAVACYEQALGLDPDVAGVWYDKGCALSAMGDYAGAVECFRAAIKLDPGNGQAIHNLGQALFKLGQVDQAIEQFRLAEPLVEGDMPQLAVAVSIPGSAQADHWAIVQARRAWADQLPRREGGGGMGGADHRSRFAGRDTDRPADGRLRVGYVSSFLDRRNWMKPVWGLINHHDRERFEVHLFSDSRPAKHVGPSGDTPAGGYSEREDDHWHNIRGMSNPEVAALIERCGVDVLIDLNGYSRSSRLGLFALEPAPVIAAWFNTYATTGLDCFDYLVGDTCVIPPDEEAYYTEQIERVGGCYLAFEVGYLVPAVAPSPCEANGYVTFGCLASQYKITTEVIGAWSRILEACPGSRLLLKNKALGTAGNCGFVSDLFKSFGVDPGRIDMEGPDEHYAFLEAYGRVDVALDTFPYNGGTTTTEALWQGVPVVCYYGDRWVGRTSATLMRAAGLGEYVAIGVEGYVALAAELAQPGAAQRLSDLRGEMRAMLGASAACDTAGLARDMEGLYKGMWRRWCEGR